jgi:undecaprenyl-diphosphatase
MDYITSLLPAIDHFHSIGYWLALFAALLETTVGIGLFIPGSMFILFLGALSAQGYLDVGDLLWFAIAGAIIGDNVNYYLGRKYGSKFTEGGIWFIKPEYLKKGKTFFDNHGVKSVFIGRFIPSVKEIIPLIAGTVKMDRRSFFLWNVLGAIGWGFMWVLPGYIFAQSLNLAQVWMSRVGFFLAIIFASMVVFYLLEWIVVKKGKEYFTLASSVWLSVKKAIVENKDVEEFIGSHPRLFLFIKDRFDRKRFWGLPSTVLSFVFLYVLILFAGIVEDIITFDVIVSLDTRIENLLFAFRDAGMVKVFLWITLLGKPQTVFLFTVITAMILWFKKMKFYIMPLLVTITGSVIFTYLSKIAFHRVRPDVAVYAENSFSFPSGHATIAVAFYGFLMYLFIHTTKQWGKKVNIFFAGLLLIIAIGFSRLYLGVHYLSDVWAGYLVGALWLIVSISIVEWKQFGRVVSPAVGTLGIRVAQASLIGFAAVFYVGYAISYNPSVYINIAQRQDVVVPDIMDIFSNDRLKYTETITGDIQEPLNFIVIIDDEKDIKKVFSNAGWFMSDRIDVLSIVELAKTAVLNKPYHTAPMTPSFWNARVNDIGFEKPTKADTVRERHHSRFWRTDYLTYDGKRIYVGTASMDVGVKWGVTHNIKSDIDTERDSLFQDLLDTKRVVNTEKIRLTEPKLGKNFSGDLFFTDGKAYVLTIE